VILSRLRQCRRQARRGGSPGRYQYYLRIYEIAKLFPFRILQGDGSPFQRTEARGHGFAGSPADRDGFRSKSYYDLPVRCYGNTENRKREMADVTGVRRGFFGRSEIQRSHPRCGTKPVSRSPGSEEGKGLMRKDIWHSRKIGERHSGETQSHAGFGRSFEIRIGDIRSQDEERG
jgi:hypothetical protein